MEESQPLRGRTMALETRYEVSTQVLSSCPAERLPAICGSATLAMLVSSTSMNVASVTVRAMIHGLTAGRQAAASFMVIEAAPIRYLNLGCELRARSYLIHTFGTTDIPGRSSWPLISPGSNTIFIGMRCTTLT